MCGERRAQILLSSAARTHAGGFSTRAGSSCSLGARTPRRRFFDTDRRDEVRCGRRGRRTGWPRGRPWNPASQSRRKGRCARAKATSRAARFGNRAGRECDSRDGIRGAKAARRGDCLVEKRGVADAHLQAQPFRGSQRDRGTCSLGFIWGRAHGHRRNASVGRRRSQVWRTTMPNCLASSAIGTRSRSSG